MRSADIQVRYFLPPKLMNYVLLSNKGVTHYLRCGSSTRPILFAEARLGAEEKERKERKQTMFLHHERCRRSRSSYRYQETEEGELSNSFKTCAKCRVLNSPVRDAGTNFGRQRLSHGYVLVFAERMRRKSCLRKWKRELFAGQLVPRKDQK